VSTNSVSNLLGHPYLQCVEETVMVRLAVTGAAGRMGARIIELASQDERFQVIAALEVAGHPKLGHTVVPGVSIADSTTTGFDVMVDFSHPDATLEWLDAVEIAGKPMVIGTTGHTREQLGRIAEAAKRTPVVKAANMSVGVNLLLRLVGEVARILGPDYDIEIVEAHHRFKKDAPSGTALALADAICRALDRRPAETLVYGREGREALREAGTIGVHALRLGDTVGEHEVLYGTLGETISIRHSAHTRDTFVKGALRAAFWVTDKKPGLYTMQDVLFGK
jgi:4-hydroxy-tetrahydrodipicolinate reductase